MRGVLRVCLPVLFVVVGFAAEARACSCAGGDPPCQAYWQASAVFVGTPTGVSESPRLSVEEARKLEDAGEPVFPSRVFRFAVERPLRGVEGATVEVGTGMGGGDCGYGFRVGARYLVYAYRDEKKGTLHTGICTRTRPLGRADDDLRYIDELARGPAVGGTIFGQVTRERRVAREDGDETTYEPLAEAVVEIAGGGKTFRAVTDGKGNFAAKNLPAGAYKVKLELSETLLVRAPVREVEVGERGCAKEHFSVVPNGRLRGRVYDSEGRPAAKVALRLSDASKGEMYFRGHTNYATTDAEGRYEFQGIPTGRYILKLRFDGAETDSERPFPVFYHPNVSDPARAAVISVGEGELAAGYDLHLPPVPAERTVEGVVVYADGTPAAGVNVGYSADQPHANTGYSVDTDAAGRFTIKVYEGVGLKMGAGVQRADGQWVSSPVVTVPASGPVGEVKIIVPRP